MSTARTEDSIFARVSAALNAMDGDRLVRAVPTRGFRSKPEKP